VTADAPASTVACRVKVVPWVTEPPGVTESVVVVAGIGLAWLGTQSSTTDSRRKTIEKA
jgi:hypothetical protein